MRYKIIIEYDGTPFVGWQRQDNGLSVQECIETAIESMFQEKPVLFGAGRTDAGVHATGQVAHCLLYTSPSPRDATLSRMPSSA